MVTDRVICQAGYYGKQYGIKSRRRRGGWRESWAVIIIRRKQKSRTDVSEMHTAASPCVVYIIDARNVVAAAARTLLVAHTF